MVFASRIVLCMYVLTVVPTDRDTGGGKAANISYCSMQSVCWQEREAVEIRIGIVADRSRHWQWGATNPKIFPLFLFFSLYIYHKSLLARVGGEDAKGGTRNQ